MKKGENSQDNSLRTRIFVRGRECCVEGTTNPHGEKKRDPLPIKNIFIKILTFSEIGFCIFR